MKGKIWRIGLMGESSTEGNVLLLLYALEKTLQQKVTGWSLERG